MNATSWVSGHWLRGRLVLLCDSFLVLHMCRGGGVHLRVLLRPGGGLQAVQGCRHCGQGYRLLRLAPRGEVVPGEEETFHTISATSDFDQLLDRTP
jgi:hypothetical protein